jgi:hypothetical protein
MAIRFEIELLSREECAALSCDAQLKYLERMVRNLEGLLGEARVQQDCVRRLSSLRRSADLLGVLTEALPPRIH